MLIVLATSCAHQPPRVHPVDPPAVATTPQATPTPAPAAPAAMPKLAPTPAHRVLEWFVDVIGHRKGDVSREEIAEYCGPEFLGPTAGTVELFRKWAKEADGAVLESLEVDDPTYVRGYLATREHRWKLVLEIDRATSKLMYLRLESAR
jgi:hypothetical protein